MPTPADTTFRSPADFSPLLATDEPVLLVGGQAVNLWALHYHDRTGDLAPFVSRDADVLGDRETLTALGRLAGVRPQLFPLKPPSNEVGVVIARDAKGAPMLVEVLRYVNGASNEELRDPAYEFDLGEHPARVRIPGPIALLKAKVANLAEIKQAGRQDGRHVVILSRVIPGYIEDLRASAAAGRIPERALIGMLEYLLTVVTSPPGRKAWDALKISPRELFAELEPASLPKLRSFLDQRLPRVLAARLKHARSRSN